MDVLASETRWALNNEIKKQVISSWSPFIQHIIVIFKTFLILPLYTVYGARDESVGWGSALRTGRTRIRFPMVSLEFFVDINFWPHYGTLTEMSTRSISLGEWRRPLRRIDNFTTLMCRLSWNLGSLTSWNLQDLSRPVQGLLYLYTVYTF